MLRGGSRGLRVDRRLLLLLLRTGALRAAGCQRDRLQEAAASRHKRFFHAVISFLRPAVKPSE
jgi:hypothetical protein